MSLRLEEIDMSFGANRVLKGVNFELLDGEIHALLGENGAGKSTLLNIIGGVFPPVSGRILLNGNSVRFSSPTESLSSGIAFIHQELSLINDLSVYENLYLGNEIKHGVFLDRKAMINGAREVLERLKINVEPTTNVGGLDASYKQIIEIARAVLFNARIVIMDEPTTSLTKPEIERVFDMMRTLKSHGVSIIFVSHKLKEVMTICDSYTVLRDGINVSDGSISDTNEVELARLMVGHEIISRMQDRIPVYGDEILRVNKLTLEPRFRDISFSLKAGEILGFTGLLGDGRSELFQTVFGYSHAQSGEVFIKGKPANIKSTQDALKYGIGYVPRDRKENGIIKDMTILENGSIVTYDRLGKPLLSHKKETESFDAQVQSLRIKLADTSDLITSLSGGNQQKVVLSKWLLAEPSILIFDNPTQGVDVGAKEEIYAIIAELAKSGVGVVVLSSEAQEILRLCDRVLVMYHGSINAELTGEDMTQDNIMVYATGAGQEVRA